MPVVLEMAGGGGVAGGGGGGEQHGCSGEGEDGCQWCWKLLI